MTISLDRGSSWIFDGAHNNSSVEVTLIQKEIILRCIRPRTIQPLSGYGNLTGPVTEAHSNFG